jgi:hypothetical protein
MSKVRVVFAEVDGSDEMIRSVISQMTEKVGARVVMEAAPIAEAPRLLRAAPTKMPRNTGRVKTAVAALGGGSTASPGEEGTVRGTLGLAVLQALRHGDLTSIQTFESVTKAGLKTTSGSVYQTLRVLAGKGRIKKTQNDEGVTSWARVE